MIKEWALCVLSEDKIANFNVKSMFAVGGAKSSGFVVGFAKKNEDYAIVSPEENGLKIHPLLGAKEGTRELRPYECCKIGELTFLVLPATASKDLQQNNEDRHFIAELAELVEAFAERSHFNEALSRLLKHMLKTFSMDRGLLTIRDPAAQTDPPFRIVAAENISPNHPWFSESLLLEAIAKGKEIHVQNIIGSAFQSSHSLMATGFLAVSVWPLVLKGKVLGALLIGCDRPHSGLSAEDHIKAKTLVQLASLLLDIHLEEVQLREQIDVLRKKHDNEVGPFLTSHEPLRRTCVMAKQIADTDLSVLIQGETGVGKEVMAHWIHQLGSRSRAPFVAVNCGSIPNELLESLLFGHVKGAFTGAVRDQKGKFELANNGTLFLDEIGDLSEHLQVKLLRVLQERVIEPVGSGSEKPVNVRIVAATHKHLLDAVRAGRFREDLFYRLAEIQLDLPPLRERVADVMTLATHFLNESAPDKKFSAEAWGWLKSQPWRGNVRELKSTIKRAVALCPGYEIESEHFSLGSPLREEKLTGSKPWLGGETLEDAKQSFIQQKVRAALGMTGQKRNEAADLLGITPRTLFRYLEEMGDGPT